MNKQQIHRCMRMVWAGLIGLTASLSPALPPPLAQAQTTTPLNCSSAYQIVQTLSNSAKWEMCWEPRPGYGYRLSQVIFTPPGGVRRLVLDQLHVAQLFVPYDDNGPRYHDISYGVNMATLSSAECPGGSLLGNAKLCLMRRPRGYAFNDATSSQQAQGESFATFGYFSVGQYYYIFQYTFNDDGSLEPSIGASGSLQRFGGNTSTGWPVRGQVGVNHNHFVIWRMDFDLDGATNDIVEQVDFGGEGSDGRNMTITALNTETKVQNNLNNLRFWRVRDGAKANADGHAISYEIEPNVSSQFRAGESFTANDFYATQQNTSEILVDDGNGLDGFVNGQALTDPVLWYSVNFHHVPRDEDDVRMPAHFQGFIIRPRDMQAGVNGSGTVPTPTPTLAPTATPIAPTPTVPGPTPTGVLPTPTFAPPTPTANPPAATPVPNGQIGTQTFGNAANVAIPDSGAASPYPATLNVSNMGGTISKVTVKLKGLSHTYPSDLDVLLVGPNGQQVVLMSDAGSGNNINNVTLTIDDAASQSFSRSTINTGSYRPTNLGSGDGFPAPAPGGSPATALSAFNSTAANGVWRLFVVDDQDEDTGTMSGGWEVTITTQ
jgi:primary-amine oxidase